MLLIGSRAAKHHFASFRAPQDWDVVATVDEARELSTRLTKQLPSGRPNKLCFRFRDTLFEVEIAHPGSTARELLRESRGSTIVPGVGVADVASPEALLLIKQSHVPFAIHWQKTTRDIRFLQRKVGDLPPHLARLGERRLAETAGFLHPSQKRGARGEADPCAGRRTSPLHGRIHDAVKLGDRAARDADVPILSLPSAARTVLLAEEAMSVAVERLLGAETRALTAAMERYALERAYEHVVTAALPPSLRPLAVSVMDRVLSRVPAGFAKQAIARLLATSQALPPPMANDPLLHDDYDLFARYCG